MIANEATDRSRLDRDIAIFTVEADGRYRRADEHHVLCLYESAEVAAILSDAGFDVDVLDNYRSPTVHPPLPGWYVVEARKR